jgi:uncharacterized membrane protein (DUF485 family)
VRHAGPARWEALASEPEFRALLRARRRFVLPATIFFIAYYLALPISAGFFPGAMSRPIFGPLTIAYVFALSQFAVAWLLLALYLRVARSFDVRAAKLRRRETHELLDTQR